MFLYPQGVKIFPSYLYNSTCDWKHCWHLPAWGGLPKPLKNLFYHYTPLIGWHIVYEFHKKCTLTIAFCDHSYLWCLPRWGGPKPINDYFYHTPSWWIDKLSFDFNGECILSIEFVQSSETLAPPWLGDALPKPPFLGVSIFQFFYIITFCGTLNKKLCWLQIKINVSQ